MTVATAGKNPKPETGSGCAADIQSAYSATTGGGGIEEMRAEQETFCSASRFSERCLKEAVSGSEAVSGR